MNNGFVDETLIGNERIEEAIHLFLQENSDWAFMGVCMAIRKRVHEDGHMVFPVEMRENENGQDLYDFCTLEVEEGASALVAFTSREELEKGPSACALSYVLDPVLENILHNEGVAGLWINPWSEAIFLGKEDIALILTPGSERFV